MSSSRNLFFTLFFPELSGRRSHAALLVLRLVAGAALMFHGFKKIQAPFSWMGPDSSMPGFLQALAALSEFGGGLAWVLGLLTPLASFGVVATMAVAALTHIQRGDPFVGRGGSYEPALLFLAIGLVLLASGPGKVSLDAWLGNALRSGTRGRTPEAGHAERDASDAPSQVLMG